MYKIYKIVDNTNGNIYIGITKKKYLCKRISGHRTDYKRGKLCSSREIIKNGDYRVELIEETEDETRERYWIENTDCINKQIPNRTRKEYSKEYYENNKDIIIEKKKEYSKEHYQNNKEYILKLNKEHKKYVDSIGGDPRYNNNLLRIDVNLLAN